MAKQFLPFSRRLLRVFVFKHDEGTWCQISDYAGDHLHNHLSALKEGVADELASSKGDLRVGHTCEGATKSCSLR